MLLKTTEELKNYVPVNAEFDFKNLTPYVTSIEENVIKKTIGTVLYDLLLAAYEDNTTTDMELLLLCQNPLANFAMHKYVPFGQVVFGKAGLRINTIADTKAPFEHQIRSIRKELSETGSSAIESLLAHMEENVLVYPDWEDSDGYTLLFESLVKNTKTFQDHYNIGNSRITFLALKPLIKEVELVQVAAEISQDLLTAIRAQVAAGTTTPANLAILPYLQKAIVHYAIAKACIILPVKITSDGLSVLNQNYTQSLDISTPAEPNMLSGIIKEAYETADTAIAKALQIMYANISDYPLFTASSIYVDPATIVAADQTGKGVVLF